MPQVNPIDIRAIFEKVTGRKLVDPKPIASYNLPNKPPIAGNLQNK